MGQGGKGKARAMKIAIDKQAHALAGYSISLSIGLLASPLEGVMMGGGAAFLFFMLAYH